MPFLGVWVIEMTEPAVFKGTHTIRVWDNSGTVAASLQTNPNFPAIEATVIDRDGNMLVLTLSHNAKPHPMQENGMPIWAVVSAVVDGDTMKVAQMLERSQTIKRGRGIARTEFRSTHHGRMPPNAGRRLSAFVSTSEPGGRLPR